MGCFDTVHLTCPHCERRASFQTKAGPCKGIDFELETVTGAIAEMMQDCPVDCEECGEAIYFKAKVVVSITASKNDPAPALEEDETEGDG